MQPTFADPKTDFVFKRIFGSEARKGTLVDLLNALLELEAPQRIVDLIYLTPEQTVPVNELKLSAVDVKCRDETGRQYVVEMQVLNVEGFEKRIVYNASKAYVMQLKTAEGYPELCDVVGVSICDFAVWPESTKSDAARVPMLSRWRMEEQHGGMLGLSQVQYVFLELPKYAAGEHPQDTVDKWAFFFRKAEDLDVIPPDLESPPFKDAFDAARTSAFTTEEWDTYDRAKMAEQDARGSLSLAQKQARAAGHAEGHAEGRAKESRAAIIEALTARGVQVDLQLTDRIDACNNVDLLKQWFITALTASSKEQFLDDIQDEG